MDNPFHQGLLLFSFLIITSITPGPNNLMLAASALNFGWRRTLPHVLGIMAGFPLLVIMSALGLGEIFNWSPWLRDGLLVFGCSYLFYMSYRLFSFTPVAKDQAQKPARPFSFWEIVGFQWLNPKALIVSLTVVSSYWFDGYSLPTNALLLGGICLLSSLPSVVAWVALGVYASDWLNDTNKIMIFNRFLAVCLALTSLSMLILGL